jgi:hypothetical protein
MPQERKEVSRGGTDVAQGTSRKPKIVVLVFLCGLSGLCVKNEHTKEWAEHAGISAGHVTREAAELSENRSLAKDAKNAKEIQKSVVKSTDAGFIGGLCVRGRSEDFSRACHKR